MQSSSQSRIENFMRYFSVEYADSFAQKQTVFALRYRVFCEEFQFESPSDFPDGLEYDHYDSYAQHCLIRHRETQLPAGCIRLVPAVNGNLDNCPMPFEKYCWDSLDHSFIQQLALPRQSMCEISRWAVSDIFRKAGEKHLLQAHQHSFTEAEFFAFPLISVACFLAATALAVVNQRSNVFAMMEPFLPRIVSRSGICFQRVGCDVQYHGTRAAYFITSQTALLHLQPELRELYQWIEAQIQAEANPAVSTVKSAFA